MEVIQMLRFCESSSKKIFGKMTPNQALAGIMAWKNDDVAPYFISAGTVLCKPEGMRQG